MVILSVLGRVTSDTSDVQLPRGPVCLPLQTYRRRALSNPTKCRKLGQMSFLDAIVETLF
jgi:hypothetical protein